MNNEAKDGFVAFFDESFTLFAQFADRDVVVKKIGLRLRGVPGLFAGGVAEGVCGFVNGCGLLV